MNPDNISLENLTKNFEYAKLSREIDLCDNLDEIKNVAKCYIKLYLKTQEVILNIESMGTK